MPCGLSDDVPYDPRAVRHAYEAIVDDYTARFGDELTANDFDRSVIDAAVATLPADGLVMDMGCGPGQISAHLANRGLRLVGLDLTYAMLTIARRQLPSLPLVSADGLALPLRSNALDGIVAWYAIHNLPRALLSTALAEFRRVLRAGGMVLIGTHAGQGEESVEDARADSTETVIITYYEPEELADTVSQHGFRVNALRQRPPLDHEHQVTKLFLTAIAID